MRLNYGRKSLNLNLYIVSTAFVCLTSFSLVTDDKYIMMTMTTCFNRHLLIILISIHDTATDAFCFKYRENDCDCLHFEILDVSSRDNDV